MACAEGNRRPEVTRKVFNTSQLLEDYKQGLHNRDSLKILIHNLANDSLKTQLLFDLSYFFYKSNDKNEFKYWNKETFHLSENSKDTLGIAESHWDLGNFFNKNSILDSSLFHYQKAFLFYSHQKDEFYAARMLLNIAMLQKNIKDYTGSEITSIRAISILKEFNEPKQLYIGYNNLGIVFNELEDYETSLDYHSKALEKAEILEDDYLISATLNNIGVAYIGSGNNLKAIKTFQKSLKNEELKIKHSRLYAMLIDNLAYAQFKEDSQLELQKEFLLALRIRDSIDHQAGIVINKLRLGEYLLHRNDSIYAKSYIGEALFMAKENNNHRDILAALMLLSKSDPTNAVNHLREYISLSDSLQKEERAVRNKFERIRFETDEYIAENQFLNKRQKWMAIGSTGVLFMFSFLFINRYQQSKHKKLKFKQKQQKANEEIYNLLLEQEKKIEEGGLKEKLRISRELHDGVLGKLFGVRFVLSNLNDKTDLLSIAEKEKYLEELRAIEEEIRNISHDLQRNKLPEEIGFLNLIQTLLKEKKEVLKAEVILKSDNSIKWEKISNKSKMNLYRIIQESLQNTIKYAQASIFQLEFRNLNNSLLLNITDNGSGFDLNKKPSGIGLKNIKERVKELKGKTEILSDEAGTIIQIIIPK